MFAKVIKILGNSKKTDRFFVLYVDMLHVAMFMLHARCFCEISVTSNKVLYIKNV